MKIHFSSKTSEWETPRKLFDELDKEFHFNVDPCATRENAKCEEFYTKKENGLTIEWIGNIFMNPRYGREIGKWIRKAYESSLKDSSTVVCLLPARTDTKWFHDYCMKGEIRFLRGRLKFGGAKNSAPFPSMIVIFGRITLPTGPNKNP
mgnify:CR=1 FL=1